MRRLLSPWLTTLAVCLCVGCASRPGQDRGWPVRREPAWRRSSRWRGGRIWRIGRRPRRARRRSSRSLRSFSCRFGGSTAIRMILRRVKALRKSGIRDPRLARQVDKLYYAYLQNQIEPDLLKQIVELDTKVQEAYNNYRATMDGRKVTMSDIYTTLTTETDCGKREAAWRASKQVGNVIVGDFLKLVRLRNQAARRLGFDNFHTMTIVTGEQNVAGTGPHFR